MRLVVCVFQVFIVQAGNGGDEVDNGIAKYVALTSLSDDRSSSSFEVYKVCVVVKC
jgi:hypothetical protein